MNVQKRKHYTFAVLDCHWLIVNSLGSIPSNDRGMYLKIHLGLACKQQNVYTHFEISPTLYWIIVLRVFVVRIVD